MAEHTFSTARHATIAVPAPSRVIYSLRFPPRGVFRAWLAVTPGPGATEASVTFRVGISDERIYEPLTQQQITSSETAAKGWIPLTADVSLYGGRHWSLFHRPDERQWKLILNADAGYGVARAFWGAPGVDTDKDAARAWRQRASVDGRATTTSAGR